MQEIWYFPAFESGYKQKVAKKLEKKFKKGVDK